MQKNFILIFIACCKIARQLLHDEVMKYGIGSGKFITFILFFSVFILVCLFPPLHNVIFLSSFIKYLDAHLV